MISCSCRNWQEEQEKEDCSFMSFKEVHLRKLHCTLYQIIISAMFYYYTFDFSFQVDMLCYTIDKVLHTVNFPALFVCFVMNEKPE